MTPRAYGYCRCSRDETADGRPVAEKLEDRAGQVRQLAAEHGLTLVEVLREAESGVTIADRPVFSRLLDLCRRRECTHIVTPEQARVLRGDKRDEAEIEDVFSDAGITLVSHEGKLEFGSEEFDPLPYEIRALVARHEIRQYVRRRKRANAEKLRQNKRYGGPVPYGYLDPDYTPDPVTYPILCRILQEHIAGKPLNRIKIDLEADGIPSPRGKNWSRTSLRAIVLNPVYAGRHSQQHRVVRINGKRVLRPIPLEDWVVAETPGEWEHPITFEQWLSIRNRYAQTTRPYYAVALLSGLLYCQAGHPMVSSGERAYTCVTTDRHPGMSINKPRAEKFVFDAIEGIIMSLPPDTLGHAEEPVDREQVQKEFDRALKRFRDASAAYDDLVERALYYQQLFEMDNSRFEELVTKRRQDVTGAREEMERLQAAMSEPVLGDLDPLLCEVRELGFERVWNAMGLNEQRALVSAFFSRIEVPVKDRPLSHTKTLTLHPRDWCKAYAVGLPHYQRRGNSGNGPYR
jgi:DNA invertase Pin-like site-specific DNA recombinase